MIIAFTKDAASAFNLKPTTSLSNSLMVPELDNWVMSFNSQRGKNISLTLIHKRSLFSVTVASPKHELDYCLQLLREQLYSLLCEAGLPEHEYCSYFDDLFQQVNIVKHNDQAISRFIGEYRWFMDCYKKDAVRDGIKITTIDISRKLNNRLQKQFDFRKPSEIFFELVKNHYKSHFLATH